MAHAFFDGQLLKRVATSEQDLFLRILWVRPQINQVAVFRIPEPDALPEWLDIDDLARQLANGSLELLPDDPLAASVKLESALSASEKKIRDKRLSIILSLVSDPNCDVLHGARRGKLLRDLGASSGTSKAHVYHLLRAWWRYGQLPNALVPSYSACGGRGKERVPGQRKRGRPRKGTEAGRELAKSNRTIGINISADIRSKLQHGKQFLNRGRTWRQAYKLTLKLYFSPKKVVDGRRVIGEINGDTMPSFGQFRYWVGKVVRPSDVARAVAGESGFARNNRPRIGTSMAMARGPGSIYQVDATICDVFLRSRWNPARLVGKPVLYIVVDHWSRLIVGVHVTLDPPSYRGAMFALENAMSSKVNFCLKYGINITENDWPVSHHCHEILSDRGPEFINQLLGEGAGSLGIRLSNTSPYRPDWKGIVENKFRLLQDEEFRWQPGASYCRERGAKKQSLDAQHDLASFTELMIRWILRYNASQRVRLWPAGWTSTGEGDPTPLQLWHDGCAQCGRPQEISPLRVQAALLERVDAKETEHGLRWTETGLRYRPIGKEADLDFTRVRGRKWRSFRLSVDRRDVTYAHLIGQRADEVVRLMLIDEDLQRFRGQSREEVIDLSTTRYIANAKNEAADLNVWIKTENTIQELNRGIASRTPGIVARRGPEGLQSDRNAERRATSLSSDAWLSQDQSNPKDATATAPTEGSPSLKQKRLSMLERLRGTASTKENK